MTLIGKVKNNLSNGNSWFAYSGLVVGGVSAPSTIELLNIPNTGLRDSWVKIQAFYGKPVSATSGEGLGFMLKLYDQEILKTQVHVSTNTYQETFELFIPYQSKLEIISLNSSGNNTQERGVNVLGWFK